MKRSLNPAWTGDRIHSGYSQHWDVVVHGPFSNSPWCVEFHLEFKAGSGAAFLPDPVVAVNPSYKARHDFGYRLQFAESAYLVTVVWKDPAPGTSPDSLDARRCRRPVDEEFQKKPSSRTVYPPKGHPEDRLDPARIAHRIHPEGAAPAGLSTKSPPAGCVWLAESGMHLMPDWSEGPPPLLGCTD